MSNVAAIVKILIGGGKPFIAVRLDGRRMSVSTSSYIDYKVPSLSIASMFFFAGLMITRPAIAQIAPGVQQSAAQTATITGTVTQSDGTAVSGADVRLTGAAQFTTKSDAHGVFDFTSCPYGTYSIVVNAMNPGNTVRNTIIVKGDITVAIQYQTSNSGLKTIARVSTHSAGAQINVTPASI